MLNVADKESILRAKKTLTLEAEAITCAAKKLGQEFVQASSLLFRCQGKIILTGLGKSGLIAKKIASTLSSTGSVAVFMHSSEALHGDFGLIREGDAIIAIANSGETREVLAVVRFAKQKGCKVVAITGSIVSSLAGESDVFLDASVKEEAGSVGGVPTSSCAVALALGDALAVELMSCHGFRREQFVRLHPGGTLGRTATRVKDIMRPLAEVVQLKATAQLKASIEQMMGSNFGIGAVVGEGGELLGSLSDGDIRRGFCERASELPTLTVEEVMSKEPKTISKESSATEAITLMERYKITSVFVLQEPEGSLFGLVRLHDLLDGSLL